MLDRLAPEGSREIVTLKRRPDIPIQWIAKSGATRIVRSATRALPPGWSVNWHSWGSADEPTESLCL